MPLSIRNPETVALAREVAARTGRTVTRTIHEALQREKAALPRGPDPSLASAAKRIIDEFKKDGRTGLVADKAFYDALYEE